MKDIDPGGVSVKAGSGDGGWGWEVGMGGEVGCFGVVRGVFIQVRDPTQWGRRNASVVSGTDDVLVLFAPRSRSVSCLSNHP